MTGGGAGASTTGGVGSGAGGGGTTLACRSASRTVSVSATIATSMAAGPFTRPAVARSSVSGDSPIGAAMNELLPLRPTAGAGVVTVAGGWPGR